ncbi:hypothetical protein GCM10009075_11070 [Sphingomonas trueperi]
MLGGWIAGLASAMNQGFSSPAGATIADPKPSSTTSGTVTNARRQKPRRSCAFDASAFMRVSPMHGRPALVRQP